MFSTLTHKQLTTRIRFYHTHYSPWIINKLSLSMVSKGRMWQAQVYANEKNWFSHLLKEIFTQNVIAERNLYEVDTWLRKLSMSIKLKSREKNIPRECDRDINTFIYRVNLICISCCAYWPSVRARAHRNLFFGGALEVNHIWCRSVSITRLWMFVI